VHDAFDVPDGPQFLYLFLYSSIESLLFFYVRAPEKNQLNKTEVVFIYIISVRYARKINNHQGEEHD